jgi:hypothetical protein
MIDFVIIILLIVIIFCTLYYMGIFQVGLWKSNKQVFVNAVPTWSRPMTNGSNPADTDEIQEAANCWYPRSRPLKHWRKQLQPRAASGGGRAGVGVPGCIPGGSVTLKQPKDCCEESYILSEYVGKVLPDGENGSCCKQSQIITSATTVLDKTYYTDSRAYLRARTKTYIQNLSGSKIEGIPYEDEAGNRLWPTVTDGPQSRSKLECGDICSNNLVYKPNNSVFSQQGAVSSSTRLDRLRLNTIKKNAHSMKKDFGVNTAKYSGSHTAPYFLKSMNQQCVSSHRTGNRFKCF